MKAISAKFSLKIRIKRISIRRSKEISF